ncbi:unnamed protein product [Fraxinus pennsylvanica]|uniref:Signal recognition particle receptor subunit beta n=1 Tax=Fraxinus pennsylvanica TaxID=56036 RepID=A0AAD1ZFD3_9LAMI|nr:unnamed protein product [Fraxinus pennsylvanica]
MGYRPCLDFSEKYSKESGEIVKDMTKYLMVVVSGGMNQQRNQIVDAVVIARILGATLVVPILQVNVIWGDESEFSDIFYLEHFKNVLANDVRIVSSLPSTHLMTRSVEAKRTPLHASPEWIRSCYLKRNNRCCKLLVKKQRHVQIRFLTKMDKEKIEELKIQMQKWLDEAQEFIQKVSPNEIYAAIGVVVFTIFLFIIIRLFKRKSSNTIALTGLSGSGKTVLFYQLRDGSSHQGTVTSMEPNDGTFVLHSETTKKGKLRPVHLVDVPGHSRLRPKLDDFLPQAAAIVFVVDAVEFLPNCRAASEYLYDILIKANVVKKKIPLLLLCNKVDKVTAHTKDFIRKQLEKEIDKLRASRTTLSSADIANEYTLGVPGEAFGFSQCQNKVTIAEASGSTGDISQLEQFIREHVKP